MKFCLNDNLHINMLDKADEIMVDYRHRATVQRLVEEHPTATIIIRIPWVDNIENIEWNKIREDYILTHEKVVLCLQPPQAIEKAKELNIPFYMDYVVDTFYELESLIAAGATYARIGTGLFFRTNELQKYDIKKRLTLNTPYYGIPREDCVAGIWIRPEDLELYEYALDVVEFDPTTPTDREEAYVRIYKDQKKWSGALNMLVTGMNHPGYNRMLPREITITRMNCNQKCKNGGFCKACYRALDLANPQLLSEYRDREEQLTLEDLPDEE